MSTGKKNLLDVLAKNPPRLVVKFRRNPDGSEHFEWGLVGAVPILSLIGQIVVAQYELATANPFTRQQDFDAFVMVWDDEQRTMDCFIHPVVPIDPLIGMLETIKSTIAASRAAQAIASQQRILGPDGNPMRR